MNSPVVVIERLASGSPSLVVPVRSELGVIGNAVWDAMRGCHCLRLPLAEYERHRRSLVRYLGRYERMAVDFEGIGGEPAPTELEIILVGYQLDGETAETCLLRLLSYQTELRNWTPQRGKKPVLQLPAPCPAQS